MARVSEIALLRELVEISELERFKSLDRIAGGVDSVACGAEMRHSGRVDGLEGSVRRAISGRAGTVRVSEIALLRELVEISELERFKSLGRIAGGIDSVACGAEMRHGGRVDGLERSVFALLGGLRRLGNLIDIGSREVTSSS